MHGKPDEILGMLSSMQKGRWENEDMQRAFGHKKATGEAATSDQRQTKTCDLIVAQREEIINGNHR